MIVPNLMFTSCVRCGSDLCGDEHYLMLRSIGKNAPICDYCMDNHPKCGKHPCSRPKYANYDECLICLINEDTEFKP